VGAGPGENGGRVWTATTTVVNRSLDPAARSPIDASATLGDIPASRQACSAVRIEFVRSSASWP
jgi:hypothetical protein